MAKMRVWNATTHVVRIDGGELLDPAKSAWVDVAGAHIQELLASGELIDTGEKEPVQEPAEPVVHIPSNEEIAAMESQAAKPKASKSKKNVSEDTEPVTDNEVQSSNDSNGEVTDSETF